MATAALRPGLIVFAEPPWRPGRPPRTHVGEWWRNDLDSRNDAGVVAGQAPGQTGHTHRLRGLAVTGFIATLAAVVATTLAAAVAQAVGVDFEVPDGGETIPLSGFAVVTGFFSLTAISLVPPLLSGQTPPPPPPSWGYTSSLQR